MQAGRSNLRIFVFLAMEILALLLKKNCKSKPYQTKIGLKHFLDMYADDLSIYLEYNRNRESENRSNVQSILQTMDKFREWSGLKINLAKTYLKIFGKQHKKLKFVDE